MSPRFPDPARFAGSRLLRVQSDERLVALTRDGYEAAFSAIVDRYRTPLERYAGRIVGESRAEDAVQQAFANAHRALMRDDRPIALKAWLYRITHNASLNQLRAIHDEVTLDDETLGRPAMAMAATHDTTSVAELQARLRETLDLIAALPAKQRDALLLAELEGRSHEEIALALDIPSETVRHRVMQARTTLRAAVSSVIPYPIAAQLAGAAAAGSESARTAAELAAGAGAGAVAIKITAGLTATGAVITAFALPSLDTKKSPGSARADDVVAQVSSARADDPRTRAATAQAPGDPLATDRRRATVTTGEPSEQGALGAPARTISDLDLGLGDLTPTAQPSLGYVPAAVALPAAAETTPDLPAVTVNRAGKAGSRDDDDRIQRSGGRKAKRKRGGGGSGISAAATTSGPGPSADADDQDATPAPATSHPARGDDAAGHNAQAPRREAQDPRPAGQSGPDHEPRPSQAPEQGPPADAPGRRPQAQADPQDGGQAPDRDPDRGDDQRAKPDRR